MRSLSNPIVSLNRVRPLQAFDVDGVRFTFPTSCSATQYDGWAFYRKQVNRIPGIKAADLVAIMQNASTAYLVEVKDYRGDPRTQERRMRTKPSELPVEVAEKVSHTLGGVRAARTQARDAGEQGAADAVCRAGRLRIVLHLEQSSGSRLFPRIVDPANLQTKLRRLLKAVDPHAAVVSAASMGDLPRTVD